MEQKSNNPNKSTVKILRLVTGEEICCEIPEQNLKGITLIKIKEPMLIKYVPHITQRGISDYIALVKWVGFTDDKIIQLPKDKIITICNATKPFSDRYKKLLISVNASGQPLPDFMQRDLNNKEYNDLDVEDELENTVEKLNQIMNMPSKKIH